MVNWIQKYQKGKVVKDKTTDAITGPAGSHMSNAENLRLTLDNKTESVPLYPSNLYDFNKVGLSDDLFNLEQKKIKNWLEARNATGRFNDQLSGKELEAQLINLASVNNTDRYSFYNAIADKSMPNASWGEKANWLNNEFIKSIGVSGAYNKGIHSYYTRDPKDESTKWHENTHALNALYQKDIIHGIIPWQQPYLDDPSEIYSRLMEYRIINKIDPNKIFTIEDIKRLKARGGPKFNLVDRYSAKELLRLFNEVADIGIGTEEKNNIPTAQSGRKINWLQKGGYIGPLGTLRMLKDLTNSTIKARLANNIHPVGYGNVIPRSWNAVVLNKKELGRHDDSLSPDYNRRLDALNLLMGFKPKHDSFKLSEYRPSKEDNPNLKYYTFKDESLVDSLINSNSAFIGKTFIDDRSNLLGVYKVDSGADEAGKYKSFYDKWDVPWVKLLVKDKDIPRFYDRRYNKE